MGEEARIEESLASVVPAGYTDDPGWLVDTRIGRLLISTLAVVFLFFIITWNLPESGFRDEVRPPIQEAVWAAGIAQDWGVFAPNPVSTSWRVEADVTFADGSIERYEFPDGEPFVGAYREFRWRKFESRIRKDENRSRWEPTARWIADRYAPRDVVQVDLIRRKRRVPEPGRNEVREWESEVIYTLRISAERSP